MLGLVQGLTEFIPVSSTAHLRIVPALLGWNDPGAAFSAVIQLGTLAAVFAYFWADILRLGRAALGSLVSPQWRTHADARLAWGIAAGNVPIVVLGLAFKDVIETDFRSLLLIAAMLALVALALAWTERRGEGDGAIGGLGLKSMLMIGCFQSLALIPGASRSGSTILGGLLLGLRRVDAARFSFLLGIPAIFGSGLFQLPTLLQGVSADGFPLAALGVGLLAAAVSGYASIGFLLRFLQTRTTGVFIVYRLALAAVVAGLWWLGWVS
ncbi:MAG: undecaprenyl-diphosphatase UppP [bacterium]